MGAAATAYATATVMLDLSCICDLHRSLWQPWILHLLTETRGGTHILMDTRQVLNPMSHNRNSLHFFFLKIVHWHLREKVEELYMHEISPLVQ